MTSTATIQALKATPFMARVIGFFWIAFPAYLRRISPGIALHVLDGYYLIALPKPAVFLSPAALLLGFLIGWLQPGYEHVFIESMAIMVIVACIGIINGHLGFLIFIGFVLGDFLFSDLNVYLYSRFTSIENIWRVWLPALIEYTLFAMIAFKIPTFAKILLAQLSPSEKFTDKGRTVLAMAGYGLLIPAFSYFWAQSAPVLMRPLFTWQKVSPTVAMAAPLQTQLWILLVSVTLAAVIRVLLQYYILKRPAFSVYAQRYENEMEKFPAAAKPLVSKVHPIAVPILHAVWLTFLLAGVFAKWTEALILGGFILLLMLVRYGIVFVPLERWSKFIHRLPLLIRFGIGILIIQYIAKLILRQAAGISFRTMLVVVGISFLVFYLLNPGVQLRKKKKNKAEE